MANTRTYVHDEMTVIDAAGNEHVTYHKNTLMDVVTSEKSNVTAVGKIMFATECSTPAATVAKVVTANGFALVNGAHLVVKFTNGITVANATLNVNNLGAKNIKLNGANLPAGIVLANNQIILKYNGTDFDIVGGAGSTRVSNHNTKKIYFIGVDNASLDGTPTNEYYNTTVYVSAAGDTLCSPYFEGNGSKLTALNATQITSGTLNAARLPNSGATAGSYGTSTAVTLGFGDTFNVPYVTVDKYGRATAIKNVAIKLPANPDTDVKVTSTANNSSTYYVNGPTSSATSTGTLVHNTGVYVSGSRLYAPTMQAATHYFSDTAYINATSYTGQSATVKSISAHLEDGLTSTSTSKAATANAARKLSASISSLESTVSGHTTSIANINTSITNLSTSNTNLKSATQTAINSLINQLGTQATFSLSGTTLTITTKSKPSVTV